MNDDDIELSEERIKRMTGYSRPTYQEKMLRSLGIPCRRRPDNSLLVLRRDCVTQSNIKTDHPKRKSERR